MASKNILLTDDISNFSVRGKRRTHQLRNFAANLSRAMNANLHFLYVEDLPEHLRKRKNLEPLQRRNPKLVERIKEDLNSLKPNTEIHIDSGSPAEKILKWTQNLNPEMIIIGTRGTRGLGKFFLGSIAEEVTRHSLSPTVVIGPNAKKIGFTTSAKKNRILLLTDLTRASKPAEDFAKKLAKHTNARITILHSVGEPIMHIKEVFYRSRLPIYTIDDQIAKMKRWARTELTKLGDRFKKEGISAQTQLVTEEREVIKDIKRELDDSYDLLVMGTHSRNKLLTTFLGSTARRACLLSPVPVAIVRSR